MNILKEARKIRKIVKGELACFVDTNGLVFLDTEDIIPTRLSDYLAKLDKSIVFDLIDEVNHA